MSVQSPRYHHFVLLVWEERDSTGRHSTWRFSLQDVQKEVRVGFKNMEELITYLKNWMELETKIISPKEISNEKST